MQHCGPAFLCVALAASLAACGPNLSPNTYSTAAVQQANKVDRGTVIGVRRVDVETTGTVGAAAGGAAGGLAGAQAPGGVGSAIGAIGGALVGGLIGTGAEHATTDTFAFEYIVRKASGDLVSVTQKDRQPLAIGTKVLVIAGNQARIVTDYTVDQDKPNQPAVSPTPTQAVPPPSTVPATVKETPLAPLSPPPEFPPNSLALPQS